MGTRRNSSESLMIIFAKIHGLIFAPVPELPSITKQDVRIAKVGEHAEDSIAIISPDTQHTSDWVERIELLDVIREES